MPLTSVGMWLTVIKSPSVPIIEGLNNKLHIQALSCHIRHSHIIFDKNDSRPLYSEQLESSLIIIYDIITFNASFV